MCDDVEYIVWQWHATVARVQRFLWPFALARAHVTLREKSSVICVGPCVTVAELACRSGAVRRAQMSF